jgi:hypothetical protein
MALESLLAKILHNSIPQASGFHFVTNHPECAAKDEPHQPKTNCQHGNRVVMLNAISVTDLIASGSTIFALCWFKGHARLVLGTRGMGGFSPCPSYFQKTIHLRTVGRRSGESPIPRLS